MRPIPVKMRHTLEAMPRMRECEMAQDALYGSCEGKIDWHHVWIYAGMQINEVWAILAGCKRHHDMVKTDKRVREAFERRSLEIVTDEELARYPNKNWMQLKKYLKVQ